MPPLWYAFVTAFCDALGVCSVVVAVVVVAFVVVVVVVGGVGGANLLAHAESPGSPAASTSTAVAARLATYERFLFAAAGASAANARARSGLPPEAGLDHQPRRTE